MSFVLGYNCKLYVVDPAETAAAWPASGVPSGLTLVTLAKDVTLNLERSEADVTVRGGNGWRQTVGTLRDASIDFQLMWDDDNKASGETYEFLAWIRNAYLGVGENDWDDVLGILVLDGAAAASASYTHEGLYCAAVVTNMSRSESLEEAVMLDVSLKPTVHATISPEWVETNAT